jgi:quinol monooxygenase YgiN
MTKIAIVAKLRTRPGQAEAFEKQTVAMCQTVSEQEPGNIFYHLCRTDDPDEFVAFELYEDQAAVEAHRASDHVAQSMKTVPDMIEPDIRVDILEQVY